MPASIGVEHLDAEDPVLAKRHDFRVHRAGMDMDQLATGPINDRKTALRVGRGVEEAQKRCLKVAVWFSSACADGHVDSMAASIAMDEPDS